MRHSRGYRTLFHEATHQLQFERSTGRTPTWLVEGLAMYFESFVEIAERRAQKTKGMVPMYLGDLKKSVREERHVKVSDLVNSTHSQFHSGRECLKYCESGALIHYLMFGKKGAYCDKFKGFIQGKGKDDLYAHIGIDKNQLEKEFLAYVPNLLNYSDKLLVTFKERWQIAHQDVSSPEFRLCLARVLRVKGSFDEARRELEKVAKKDKEGKYKTRIKYEEGVIHYYEGKWRKARNVLEEVSAKMKDNAQLFYFLADTCRQLNDLPASVKYYEKSAEVEPDFFAARYEVALIYLQQNKTKKAIKHLEACTKLKPVTWTKLSEFGLDFQISNIREILGTAYIQEGQYGKAITVLEEYLKEDASPTGYYHLALAYSKTGKKKEAVDALDTGLAFLKPELEAERKRFGHRRRAATFKTSVLNAMLDLYLTLGEEEKALSALELLKKFSGDTVQLHATMAKLYAKQGKTEEVLKEIDKMVELKPADSFHLEDVAIALKKLKEFKTGAASLGKSARH
jgi:tetratricopeptide (TPR) repeat protein